MQKAAYFDITAFLSLLSGEKNILTAVETYRDFYTGSTVAASLIGAEEFLLKKKVVKSPKIRTLLRAFKILSVSEGDSEKAGEILGALRAEGREIGIDDAIVAAQCIRKGLTLITTKAEFKNIPQLEVKKI